MTDNRTTELLPCPFCGGEAALVPTKETTVCEWFVTCGNLECSVLACRTKRYYTEAEAIATWNTRADTEYGAIPATDENMAKYGWVRVRECRVMMLGDCSECGSPLDFDKHLDITKVHVRVNYCPNCGAKVVEK